MTIGFAVDFVKRGLVDTEFRDRLNTAESADELYNILFTEGLRFSQHEFENAINTLLVKCQHIEAASQLREFQMWWEMLQQITGVEMCQQNCSSCCK